MDADGAPASRWPRGFLLALGIFAALRGVELFLLPINFFTFRPWEALVVYRLNDVLPGPFYPSRHLEMEEEGGDLAPYAAGAARKRVVFITDRRGYRKAETPGGRWDVVIGGDSYAGGASLSQDEMLDASLEKIAPLRVYPLAPYGTPEAFLRDDRFSAAPPRVFVFAGCETWLNGLKLPGEPPQTGPWERRLWYAFLKNHTSLAVLADRFEKNCLYEYAVARLKRLFRHPPAAAAGRMIFAPDSGSLAEDRVEPLVRSLVEYEKLLRAKGVRFIFLPLPSKNNLYFDAIPGAARSPALARLVSRARAAGLEVIDIVKDYDAARRASPESPLWQADDTHWNPAGVALTARVLARELARGR